MVHVMIFNIPQCTNATNSNVYVFCIADMFSINDCLKSDYALLILQSVSKIQVTKFQVLDACWKGK